MSKDTNNFSVAGGPTIAVKKVDSSDASIGKRAAKIESRSNAADASMDRIKNAPAPRNPRAGQNDDGGLLNSNNRGA